MLRHCSASAESRIASQPPMLASPSFLALIVMPSARAAMSWTMSTTERSAWPGSRVLMNHAFSANRQASRNSGTPWRSHTARTARRFSSETGWPPPELFVTVTKTTGTRSPLASSSVSSRVDVHVPLERVDRLWVAALGDDEVDRLGARELHVGARGVEVGVVGDDLVRPAQDAEQDLLGRPTLVGGDDVREREQLLDRLEERVPRRRPGVRLVAVLDRRPLVAAHRPGSRVGQQVDEHVLGVDREQVPARRLERRRALVARRDADGLDGVDAERLDDRPREVHGLGG